MPSLDGTVRVARGRVVFREEVRLRGRIMILDHGGGVYTTYAHLSEIEFDALHVMATCQARQHPSGRAYFLRKRAEGLSEKEALRCLKRRLADVVYRQLLRDARTTPLQPT